jgi:hypothetical protein
MVSACATDPSASAEEASAMVNLLRLNKKYCDLISIYPCRFTHACIQKNGVTAKFKQCALLHRLAMFAV